MLTGDSGRRIRTIRAVMIVLSERCESELEPSGIVMSVWLVRGVN